MSRVEKLRVVVDRSRPGQRLDIYLKSALPHCSRGALQRLIEEGNILVNDRPVKATHRPRAGDAIEIAWPDVRPLETRPEALALDVLFEDEDLVVLNKPAGMVVHPAAGNQEHTLVNALLHHCRGQLSGIGGVARPGIVHRLDKDTSGCLVAAKNDAAHVGLSEQFAERQVQKTYVALLCGALAADEGDIRLRIARHPIHRKRMTIVERNGREAWTAYRVLERFPEATWTEARLHTGRTHQIRVHFEHLGCPLVGDAVYGARANRRLVERTGYRAPRQMLHASRLSLVHPRRSERMTFEAGLPDDFCQALTRLRAT